MLLLAVRIFMSARMQSGRLESVGHASAAEGAGYLRADPHGLTYETVVKDLPEFQRCYI